MNQSNFDNFDFDNFRRPIEPSQDQQPFFARVANKFKNPVVATGALIVAGVLFAGVIMVSYPGDEKAGVPVIEAETTAFKLEPDDRGGMELPYQDSTVYSSLREGQEGGVENLLEDEDPVERLDAFAAEAERIIKESQERQKTLSLIEEATGVEEPQPNKPQAIAAVSQEVEKIKPEDLMQKVEKTETAQAPASSDETIAFVKDVLNKKDGGLAEKADVVKVDQEVVAVASVPTPASEKVAAIEPAAGMAAGVAIEEGTHYIQLGSVKSAGGAAGEWAKIQDKYSAQLGNLNYRVERADLGERGVFYRIQAGPISGESATELCDQIKAISPGACLVTK